MLALSLVFSGPSAESTENCCIKVDNDRVYEIAECWIKKMESLT